MKQRLILLGVIVTATLSSAKNKDEALAVGADKAAGVSAVTDKSTEKSTEKKADVQTPSVSSPE